MPPTTEVAGGAAAILGRCPGTTKDGTIALERVQHEIEGLVRAFARVQVTGDAVKVGMEEAPHARRPTESERQVAGLQHGIGVTDVSNVLGGPDGAMPKRKCKEDTLTGRSLSDNAQGVSEVLKCIVPGLDRDSEIREGSSVSFFNAEPPASDDRHEAMTTAKLSAEIIGTNGDRSRKMMSAVSVPIRRI
jgi:hypothetical protein